MAHGALRDLAVDVMARDTVKGCVLALIGGELFLLPGMAVQTRILVLERYPQRRMGIRVAVEAARELEMRLPRF